jgi:hypothetical protein
MISARRFVLLLPLVLVIAFGCRHARTPSQVFGKVIYKGQLVTKGNIGFHRQGDNQGVYSFPIKSDGTYSGTDLPAEELIVTIETESANPKTSPQLYGPRGGKGKKEGGPGEYQQKMKERGAVPEASGDTGQYVRIPKKYADKKTSPLKRTLTAGKNELDFDLED